MTACTPMPTTFSAWRRAPTVTIVVMPASRSRATCSGRGAAAKLATGTRSRTSSSMRSAASGWFGRRFTPKGRSVRERTRPMAASSSA